MPSVVENSSPGGLVDPFQRRVSYLRLSVTDRCNLQCRYCAPAATPMLPRGDLLTLEEMLRLVRIGIGLGITKVRVTGGEPLLRRGLVDLVARLCAMPGLQDVSLTSNGTLLAEQAPALRRAGIKRLNMSLDTLDPAKFARLTGVDRYADVWRGLMAALEWGFHPVKLNAVVMRGFNDDEIERIAGLVLTYPVHVRFIEYMPIGTDPQAARRHFIPMDTVERRLNAMGELTAIASQPNDGPARRFRLAGALGEIGLIASMSRHFCSTCNRLRLTASGGLRPCLLADAQVELLGPLRRGADDDALAALFRQALALKRVEHRLDFNGGVPLQGQMFRIGG